MDKPILLSKAALKRMGWTEKMIELLLPEPILKTNPMFKSAAPMKLWEQDTVIKIMKSDEYKELSEITNKRKDVAKKSVDTKLQKFEVLLQKAIDDIKIKIIEDDDELRKLAIESKQDWYNYIAHTRGDIPEFAMSADPETVDRWVVNYIRHELTEYDSSLMERTGKTGCRKGYVKFKNALLLKIMDLYPKYKNECVRQMIHDEDEREVDISE